MSADEDWEGKARPGAQGAPTLRGAGFEGPLDWLLEMAQARRIDLARMSILDLVTSFADALEDAMAAGEPTGAELTRWAGWTVMASTLAYLRSRLLAPPSPEEAKDAEREAERLRASLLDRQAARAGADWLEARGQLGQAVFARGRPEAAAPDAEFSLAELMVACLRQLKAPAGATAYRPRQPPFWPVASAIAAIAAALPDIGGRTLTDLVPKARTEREAREAISSTLVAAMELSKQGTLETAQDAHWMPIVLSPAGGKGMAPEAAGAAAREDAQTGGSTPARRKGRPATPSRRPSGKGALARRPGRTA